MTQINENEVLLYLGYRGQDMDARLQQQIRACIETVQKTAKPRLAYRILPVTDGEIKDLPLNGNDIRELLKDCHSAVVMAATLGSESENLLRREQIKDMANAVIMDSAQSAAIENVCNNFEEDLLKELEAQQPKEPIYQTDRYSPGYGDLSLEAQSSIIQILDAPKRIGLTLTETNLMIPRKSVTCIIGISHTKQTRRKRGCESCNLFRTCPYRKEGRKELQWQQLKTRTSQSLTEPWAP